MPRVTPFIPKSPQRLLKASWEHALISASATVCAGAGVSAVQVLLSEGVEVAGGLDRGEKFPPPHRRVATAERGRHLRAVDG